MNKQLSYHHGSGQNSFVYRTLPSLLEERAVDMPDKAAHIFRNPSGEEEWSTREVVTFGDLAKKSLNIAAHLLDMGLKPGDKVGVYGKSCPEWIYLEYACLRIGVILIKKSLFSADESFAELVFSSGIKVLVTDKSEALVKSYPFIYTNNILDLEEHGLNTIEHIVLLQNHGTDDGMKSLSQLMYLEPTDHLIHTIKKTEAMMCPDDAAVTFQSSGSTGKTKLILYTHFGVINAYWQEHETMSTQIRGSKDILYNDGPFAWMGSDLYVPIIFGCTQVHVNHAITIKGAAIDFILHVFEQERVTTAFMLPYILFDIRQATETGNVKIPPALVNVITGGERIQHDILQYARATFSNLIIGYASTECSGALQTYVSTDNIDSEIWYKVYPYTEIKILDEKGHIVSLGEVGVVHLRCLYSMMGYMDPSTGSVIKPSAGWINMGDLGRMREDGSFEIIARTTEFISCANVKILPCVLEKILAMHHKVDVAVVVGVPDPRLFQEVCACVVPKEGFSLTEGELREFFQLQLHAEETSNVPKYYIFTEKLPELSNGKIDRRGIEKMATSLIKS